MLFHWKEHFSLSIFWAWQCTHFQHYQQAGPLQPLHWVIWYNHLHSNRGCVLYLISSRHWLNHWPKDLYLTLISLNHLSMLILSLTNEVLHFITTKHSYWKKKSSKKRDLSWKHHSQTREMFLNIPKATSLCWRITGLPATRVSLCRASWITKSQINTGHSVPYSLACWELGSQRWYQTPAPTSPEQTLLIGQCVLPTVSHSSLGPGFTTAWFSVCKGKSWLQTLPSFIPC